jgi:hypothetical protein
MTSPILRDWAMMSNDPTQSQEDWVMRSYRTRRREFQANHIALRLWTPHNWRQRPPNNHPKLGVGMPQSTPRTTTTLRMMSLDLPATGHTQNPPQCGLHPTSHPNMGGDDRRVSETTTLELMSLDLPAIGANSYPP